MKVLQLYEDNMFQKFFYVHVFLQSDTIFFKMVSYNLIFERIDQTLKIGILKNFLSIHKYNSNHYHVKVQSKLSIQLSMEKNYTFMPMHF